MDQEQISLSNARLLDQVIRRTDVFRREPLTIYPWLLFPCTVKVLLVADGGLYFSQENFGLSTFVSILQEDGRHYVRFELTVAHLSERVTDEQVMLGEPGIARSIKGFRFDDPSHFTPEMYDQVWLFGIETNFHTPTGIGGGVYSHRFANQATYPSDRLADAELATLSAFMNRGGGLFATGDHGLLGRCLCGSVTRARSMRLWAGTSPDPSVDEVSMGGPRRNDTNRVGHDAGTQFDDQSDDVPQVIQPTLYSGRVSRYTIEEYPHPLLCGPDGIIDVMPDHPHEGECYVPSDLTATYPFDGTPEYPVSPSGHIPPELVATSYVPAGNNADGTKQATLAHSFGSICAYDGHRAGIGRVVTDATWHHFININLVGKTEEPETSVKGRGFLASAQGRAHFEQIKAYFRNIAVWISPVGAHTCFRRKLIWALIHQERVLEAVLTTPNLSLRTASVEILYEIGRHARDVLGKSAGQCQSLRFTIDLFYEIPELVVIIDPWGPPPPEPDPPYLPWVDLSPLLSISLGGALLSLRESFPYPDVEVRDAVEEAADGLIQRGASEAIRRGLGSLQESTVRFGRAQEWAPTEQSQ